METTKSRVLIVEDNSDDEALLLRQLTKAGFAKNVRVIHNGKHALKFLHSGEHDLIAVFLDLHLPEVNGLEILEKVRGHEHLKTLPVIVMTSSNHPDEIARCHRLGVNGFVQKPITFSTFSKAIADTFHSPLAFEPVSRSHE